MDAVTLYSTWPTLESAEAGARALVEQRLIACANIVPGAVSVFRWDGEVQREDEGVMFAKPSAQRATEARDAILKLHPIRSHASPRLRLTAARVLPPLWSGLP